MPALLRFIDLYRVKLGEEVSEWLTLCGSVPQGSWLGPLCFIIFMNDMKLHHKVLSHKYIDAQ